MTTVRPLMLAIQNRNLAEAKAALARDPSQAGEALPGGISPLLFALYNGAPEIAELLRSQVDAISVHEAAALGDAMTLARRVVADAACMSSYSPDGWTPLHLAAFMGQRNAALLLISLGAPIDALSENPMRNTALHAGIAGAGGEQLAPLLLALGASPTLVGGSGVTALHLAASRGFEALVRLLLARGAERHGKTEDGKTAADLARERGHLATAAALELPM